MTALPLSLSLPLPLPLPYTMQQQQQRELPLGFRFYPTEDELVSFYLRNKLQGNRVDQLHRVIPCINIYDVEPWHLPGLAAELCQGSTDWFFFTPRQEREAHGGRPNRTTATGYWKATGSPGWVFSPHNRVIGVRRSMVFYKGKAPTGRKTKWKMNEYIAIQEEQGSSTNTATRKLRQEFRLCRVYVGSGSARAFDRRPSEAMDIIREPQIEEVSGLVAETEGGANWESVNDHDEDDPLFDWEQLNWVDDAELGIIN